jgi:hypothetical protein
MQKALWISKRNLKSFLFLPKQLLRWKNNLVAWQRCSYESYKQLGTTEEQPEIRYLYPCLGDDTVETVIEPTKF